MIQLRSRFGLAAAFLSLLSAGCPEQTPEVPQPSGPAQTSVTLNTLLDQVIVERPSLCRGVGLRDQCDGKVFDYSAANIQARIVQLQGVRRQVSELPATPDPDEKLDRLLIDQAAQEELFFLVDMRVWQKRAQFYEELFSVDSYFTRDYAPFDERAKRFVAHVKAALKQTPHIIKNLQGPLPEAFVKTDLGIYQGYAEYLRGDVVKLLAQTADQGVRDEAIRLSKELAAEAERVAKHLETIELPRADQSYALGPDKYRSLLLAQEALDPSMTEFEARAEADLQRNKSAYQKLLAQAQPTRPAADKLLEVATKITFDGKAFIESKGLMTIPPEGNIEVRETPLFMRYNSAFLDAPGPFDRPDLKAFYYITPPDPAWPAKEQEEYVMTWGSLMATTVHEAFPGHFLHSLLIRRAPTRAQKMISSYSFVEGWAHYTEELMLEQGFGATDIQNQMGQLNDALLRNCRFVVSIGLHTKGMTLQQAEDRFVNDCFQDRANARQQAFRGTFDPGYFAYTLGKLQIMELRAEAEKKLGKSFDLRKFHDALLAHGSPQVPLIRDRVLSEIIDAFARD